MNNKKNIMYIGPYRQKTTNGLLSLLISANLTRSKNNVSIRPFYTDQSKASVIKEPLIEQAENLHLDYYDTIIQHVPIKDAVKINSVTNNIIIPILNEEILDDNDISILLEFDKILVDSKILYNRLSANNKLKNKIFTYDYDLPNVSGGLSQFNIGLFNLDKKIYFIGDYASNITNIENLCHSFIKKNLSFNHVLLLYLYNLDINTKNMLESQIAKIYETYGCNSTINRVIIASIECSLESILTAHNTGSIYIDCQDDYSNSIHAKFATMLKKQIISFDETCYRIDNGRNNKIYNNNCIGVSSVSIDTKIDKAINNSFDSLIPFKKQHINQII